MHGVAGEALRPLPPARTPRCTRVGQPARTQKERTRQIPAPVRSGAERGRGGARVATIPRSGSTQRHAGRHSAMVAVRAGVAPLPKLSKRRAPWGGPPRARGRVESAAETDSARGDSSRRHGAQSRALAAWRRWLNEPAVALCNDVRRLVAPRGRAAAQRPRRGQPRGLHSERGALAARAGPGRRSSPAPDSETVTERLGK